MRIFFLLTFMIVLSGFFTQARSASAKFQDCSNAVTQRQNKVRIVTSYHPVDRIQLSVAPPWRNKSHYDVQINAEYNGNITINFKKWYFDSGISNVVLSGTTPYHAKEYAYLTNLISCAKFWSLPHNIDTPITADCHVTVLDAIINGHSNSVVITSSHTNMPLHLICSYILDSAHFPEQNEFRYWPKLAYSSEYDQICLKFSGTELKSREKEWKKWQTKKDFIRIFGFPHEIRTYADKVIWGYYLRDRGMMVVEFKHKTDKRQQMRMFLLFSEESIYPKKEWLQKPPE